MGHARRGHGSSGRNALCALALLLICLGPSSGPASVLVEFVDAGCGVRQDRPDSEMESPSTVDGYAVLEFRDADDGGAPDWAATGNVDGSSSQAWLRDSNAEITTTTTVPGDTVFVHLQGDGNDGRAEIEIDGVLKARIDMYHTPSTNNVRLVCDGLPVATHTVRVNDIGPTNVGTLGQDDVAVWGAGVLDRPEVELLDAGCMASQQHPDSAMESPATVDGRNVLEFRDADDAGAPDWTATGNVDGSSSQAWLRDSGAEIDTTTTVSGRAVFVHLQGDDNDGRTEIEIDGALKARLDMYHTPSTNNVRLVCDGLPDAFHAIRVNDIGGTLIGPPGPDDIAAWGGGVLESPPPPPQPVPGPSGWGLLLLAAALLAVAGGRQSLASFRRAGGRSA